MAETAQCHHVGDQQNDPDLGVLRRRHQPDHGGDHPAGNDALGEHLPAIVVHYLATDLQECLVGARIEDRQMQDGVGEQQPAEHIARQHHAPQAQQLPGLAQGRLAHQWQHRRQRVLGEQLLACQDHPEKAHRVAQAGDQHRRLVIRQARTEQPHRHQRQADGQASRQRRPPQRGDGPLQLMVALHPDDFMQHQRAGRLGLFHGAALFRRQFRRRVPFGVSLTGGLARRPALRALARPRLVLTLHGNALASRLSR
ncbi:MAG: hypothetical protein GAK43_00483 [Stenotrophomonas maltophilia]|nr:MAG: hypothetical protein GAK43_00483 [Stenotrophomonas maltophilia]